MQGMVIDSYQDKLVLVESRTSPRRTCHRACGLMCNQLHRRMTVE